MDPGPQVATSIFVSRHGWGWDQSGPWSGHDFHVVVREAVVVSQHDPWCRDTEAARELRLGRDTLFGVATWVGLFGVATRNWCRYRLGPIGVATWPDLLGVAT